MANVLDRPCFPKVGKLVHNTLAIVVVPVFAATEQQPCGHIYKKPEVEVEDKNTTQITNQRTIRTAL